MQAGDALLVPSLHPAPVLTLPRPCHLPQLELCEGQGGGIKGWVRYSTDVLEEASTARMAANLQALLAAAAASPATPLEALPTLCVPERELLLHGVQGAVRPEYLDAPLLHQQFAAAAAAHPDAPAVVHPPHAPLTFGQLHAAASALACDIAAAGLPPGTPVGLHLERSAEWVAAMFACMVRGPASALRSRGGGCLHTLAARSHTGAALWTAVRPPPSTCPPPLSPSPQAAGHPFVPMEPTLPRGRLVWYMEGAQPGLLLAPPGAADQESARGLLAAAGAAGAGVRLLSVDLAALAAKGVQDSWTASAPDPAAIAYILFTSGAGRQGGGWKARAAAPPVPLLPHCNPAGQSTPSRPSSLPPHAPTLSAPQAPRGGPRV